MTGSVTLCAGPPLEEVPPEIITVPEYVPAASPAGLSVATRDCEPNAATVPLGFERVSHDPPDVLAVKAIDPPPRFETVMVRVAAGELITVEKLSVEGLTPRLGCPAAVTVIATLT